MLIDSYERVVDYLSLVNTKIINLGKLKKVDGHLDLRGTKLRKGY